MLDTVSLNHIVTREGGWDTAADWKVGTREDYCDGGQKAVASRHLRTFSKATES